MSITNGYCTLAQLKNHLGRTTSQHDTELEESIEEASRYIDEKTDSFFYEKTLSNEVVDQFMLESENGLYMSNTKCRIFCPAPIISISSITEDDETLSVDDDYYIYEETGIIERENQFFSGERKAIKINGTMGYSSTPPEIRNICKILAAIFSGLQAKVVIDSEGNEVEAQTMTIPRWIDRELMRRAWIYV